MVKSYEYESEVLKQLGYGSTSQASSNSNPNLNKNRRNNTRTSNNQTRRARVVFSDEQRHSRGRIKVRQRRRLHPDLIVVAKTTLLFAAACAFLIICITSHMRVAANDREIQKLTIGISKAEAQHEALINALAVKTNQVAIANQAHHLSMIQNPEEMNVNLTYGQGKPSFGPQIADAQ